MLYLSSSPYILIVIVMGILGFSSAASVADECDVLLASLTGCKVAVDLSGWILQACHIVKPHMDPIVFALEVIYTRAENLARAYLQPIFVLEGEIPIMKKWHKKTKDNRTFSKRTCKREELNHRGIIDAVVTGDIFIDISDLAANMLALLGYPILHAIVEAEALCGELNHRGIVDAVVTDDSDVFLYGGTVVLHDFVWRKNNTRCNRYTLNNLAEKTPMKSREHIAVFSLITGGDYHKGFNGIGHCKAIHLLETVLVGSTKANILDNFIAIGDLPAIPTNSLLKNVFLEIRKYGKPFLKQLFELYAICWGEVPPDDSCLRWCRPNIVGIRTFMLQFPNSRLVSTSVLPCAVAYDLYYHVTHNEINMDSEFIVAILKECVEGYIEKYEVKWSCMDDSEIDGSPLITKELRDLVRKAFPAIVTSFHARHISR